MSLSSIAATDTKNVGGNAGDKGSLQEVFAAVEECPQCTGLSGRPTHLRERFDVQVIEQLSRSPALPD